MKKIFISLCMLCILSVYTKAHAQDFSMSIPRSAVGMYAGGEYGDGYWLLFTQGNSTLALFSPNMVIEALKGQEGKSVKVNYTYKLFYDPGYGQYMAMKSYDSFTILPNLSVKQLEDLEAKLLAEKGPVQDLLDVGACYQYGLRGIKANHEKALNWYTKLGELGISEAYNKAGDLYLDEKSSLFSKENAKEMYLTAARAGNTTAFVRMADYSLKYGYMYSEESAEERKAHAVNLYALAAKQKNIEAQAGLISLELDPVTDGFIAPQGPCPSKTVRKAVVEGIFDSYTTHMEDFSESGYMGFLVKGNDGKDYDIGIGHEIPDVFWDIAKGNTIKIPFVSIQRLSEYTGRCVVLHFHDTESSIKGSYSQ